MGTTGGGTAVEHSARIAENPECHVKENGLYTIITV